MTLTQLKKRRKNQMHDEYDKQFEIRKKEAFIKTEMVEMKVNKTQPALTQT